MSRDIHTPYSAIRTHPLTGSFGSKEQNPNLSKLQSKLVSVRLSDLRGACAQQLLLWLGFPGGR